MTTQTDPAMPASVRTPAAYLVRDLAAVAGNPDAVADVLHSHSNGDPEAGAHLAAAALYVTFVEGFDGPVPLDTPKSQARIKSTTPPPLTVDQGVELAGDLIGTLAPLSGDRAAVNAALRHWLDTLDADRLSLVCIAAVQLIFANPDRLAPTSHERNPE